MTQHCQHENAVSRNICERSPQRADSYEVAVRARLYSGGVRQGDESGRRLWDGDRIREIREARDRMSQADLAAAAGVSKSEISRHERNAEASNPTVDVLMRIAIALQVPIATLFDPVGFPIPRPEESGHAQIVVGDNRTEDYLSALIAYVRPLEGKERIDFIRAATAVLAALEHARLLEFEQPLNAQRPRLLDAKTRSRFMVRAATGRRPVEIMRALPDDVDLERRLWRVRDAKGGWSEGIYLNDDMLIAWQTFAAAGAWGDFNTGSMAEVLRAAGWPKGSRPYNLRHSTGIALSELGHDLDDIGGWLGHQPGSRVTRESYVPVLNSRMQRLSETLAGRLKGWAVARSEP